MKNEYLCKKCLWVWVSEKEPKICPKCDSVELKVINKKEIK